MTIANRKHDVVAIQVYDRRVEVTCCGADENKRCGNGSRTMD